MAEAFNIAAGAVSITAMFSTCVECFYYIHVARRFSKDFQTEILTLGMLKLRLSRWGAAVGVYDDTLLEHPNATEVELELAKNTLHRLWVLVDESKNLSSRFAATLNPGEDISILTNVDMEPGPLVLNNTIRSFAAERQKQPGFVKLVSWALYSKDDFSRLVRDIAKLLDNFEYVFPAPRVEAELARIEVQALGSCIKGQQEHIFALSKQLVEGFDTILKNELVVMTMKGDIQIGSLVAKANGRVKDGCFYSSA